MLEAAVSQQSQVLHKVETPRLVMPDLATALERIFELGMEGAPEEICGLLVNETKGCLVIPLTNRSGDRLNSFVIDNVTLRSLALKPRTWAHVAVYHTHPRGQVGPSPQDLEHKIHSVKYVVVTIPSGEVVWF